MNIKNIIKKICIAPVLLASLSLSACSEQVATKDEAKDTDSKDKSGIVKSANAMKDKANQVAKLSESREKQLEENAQ